MFTFVVVACLFVQGFVVHTTKMRMYIRAVVMLPIMVLKKANTTRAGPQILHYN